MADPDVEQWHGWLVLYGASGLFFAAGVLFPFVRLDRHRVWRAIALVIFSVTSYRAAVWMALDGPAAESAQWLAFTSASIVGAAIVLLANAWAAPVRLSFAYVGLGALAAIVGGPITSATLIDDNLLTLMAGYAAWHTLICLAIFFGAAATSGPFDISNFIDLHKWSG